MRIQIEPHTDLRAAPRSLCRGERRIEIIEIMDQWYGPGYRYVKVRGHAGATCTPRGLAASRQPPYTERK